MNEPSLPSARKLISKPNEQPTRRLLTVSMSCEIFVVEYDFMPSKVHRYITGTKRPTLILNANEPRATFIGGNQFLSAVKLFSFR